MERKTLIKHCHCLIYDGLLYLAIDTVRLAYELFITENDKDNLLLLEKSLDALNQIIIGKKISIQIKEDVKRMSKVTIFLENGNLAIEFASITINSSPVKYHGIISLDELKTIKFISDNDLIAKN